MDDCGEVKIDQVVIGSCTNGRMEDMRAAAEVLRGRKVADGVRCIVIPATQQIWLDSLHEGLFDIFRGGGGRGLPPPPAGPAWEGIWGFSPPGSGRSPPPTAISLAGWATWTVRSISPAPMWRRLPVTGFITDPAKLMKEGE